MQKIAVPGMLLCLWTLQASAQNVGIGTSSPPDPLTVRSSGIGISQETPDGSVRMGFYIANAFGGYLQTHTNHDLNFTTNNGSPQMMIQKGTGNVGIGTTTPNLAGLVVNKKIGNVHAIFGSNGRGISIESNEPTIGFNGYLSQGGQYLALANGFSGNISFVPGTGDFRFANSDFSSTAGNLTLMATRMIISGTGNVGIDNINPTDAGLVVDKKVGDAHAIFGRNSTGVSIQSDEPTVGFNGFQSPSGYRALATGYTGLISFIPGSGDFRIASSSASIGSGNFAALSSRLVVTGAGNVGIANNNPTLAGFVVDKKVGAVHALFGSNTTGVAIESNFPGLGLNTYFSGGRKFIANGFGALVSLDPATGNLSLMNAANSGNADAAASLATRLLINKDGNIGVQGNINPGAPLSFANTVGNKIAIWGEPTTGHYGIGIQASLMQLYTAGNTDDIAFGFGRSASFTERVRIKGTGNVGIGTNAPDLAGLVVNQVVNGRTHALFGANKLGLSVFSDNPGLGFNVYSSAGTAYNFVQNGYGAILEMNNATGALRYQTSIGAGTSNQTVSLINTAFSVFPNGNFGIGIGGAAPTARLQVGTNGDGSVAIANAWQTFSDERFKKDIVPIANAMQKIENLQGYYYYWNGGIDDSRQAGLLAQEVEKVLPEIVHTNNEGYKTVDYGKMNALLLQALKEQNSKVESLQMQVQQLMKILEKNNH